MPSSAESLMVDPGRGAVLIPAEQCPALGTTPLRSRCQAHKHSLRARTQVPLECPVDHPPGFRTMKKFLLALAVAAFSLAHSPTFAQDKKSDPAKEESKNLATDPAKKPAADPAKKPAARDDAKKTESVETPKDGKKKVKKGGC